MLFCCSNLVGTAVGGFDAASLLSLAADCAKSVGMFSGFRERVVQSVVRYSVI